MIKCRPALLSIAVLIACSAVPAKAQYNAALAFESVLHGGVVWRHTPKLSTHTGELLWVEELGIRFQTRGKHPWNQWQGYPSMGVNFVHVYLGAGNHGDAFALFPYLNIPILRTNRFLAVFRLGSGPAWVARPYDYFKNPGQNAIGSHLNDMVQFRLGAEYRLSPHLRVQAGAALTHFSNGGSSLPNYGINLPSGYTGLVWSPKPIVESAFLRTNLSKRAKRCFGARVDAGVAFSEYNTFDGPKYLIESASVAGMFYLNQVNRAVFGIDYEYNKAVYAWGLHVADFQTESEARAGATRLAWFLADEFLFGSIGIQVQRGWYVGDRFNRYTLRKAYSKLHMRYYLPAIPHIKIQPYLGITLKAHSVTAEYISFDTGLAF
ncbi:MAG: acyloxyacyl hydrolase [Bacteroidota bacterium]